MFVALSILSIHFFAVISPGPDMMITMKNALGFSRKHGYYTAMGIALGIVVHLTYCFLGIALIVQKHPTILAFIQITGATYLIYVGIQSIRSPANKLAHVNKSTQSISYMKALKQGFITNILNPKATLFFLSLFSGVVLTNLDKSILIITCAILITNSFIWFAVLSYLITLKRLKEKYEQLQETIQKIFGAILIGFGIYLLYTVIF